MVLCRTGTVMMKSVMMTSVSGKVCVIQLCERRGINLAT
jgi:hypothetical protein